MPHCTRSAPCEGECAKAPPKGIGPLRMDAEMRRLAGRTGFEPALSGIEAQRFRVVGALSCCSHASGINMIMAWSKPRPVISSNSKALSILAVSLAPGVMIGGILFISSPNKGDWNWASLACIQFRLPRSVLISPLWAKYRYG